MERVICFHLFNDYSGSPKVMKMVLEGLLKKGYRIDLVSSKGGIFLSLSFFKQSCCYHVTVLWGTILYLPSGIPMAVLQGSCILYQHIASNWSCISGKADGKTDSVSLSRERFCQGYIL